MTDYAVRFKNLRREMEIFAMDGFIVPRSDEHQGEYVAPCSERLGWLTGFSGSAGYAIVLAERAALFVDGRYTLQAPKEVDGRLIECRHVVDEPATDWIETHMKAGMSLAFDPWLHAGAGLHRLRQTCEKIGVKLVEAPHNFVDAIWADRPAAPLDPVFVHPQDYSGQKFEEKLDAIAIQMKEETQDAMVLSLPDSIAWALNIRGRDLPCTPVALCFAIIYQNGRADLFIDGRKIDGVVKAHFGSRVDVREPKELGQALDDLKDKTVRLDGAQTSVWIHDRLKKAGAKIAIGDDLCLLPKACKNAVEIAGMQNAHRRDGATMVRFLHWLSKQPAGKELHELFVSQKLDGLRAQDKLFVDLSFPTISGAAENGAIVHYRVSAQNSIPLPENGLYLVDSGGQYFDGTTDITRTVVRGTPSAEMKDRFTRVLKGHIALASARFPKGTTGSQLDVLARHALWQGGFDYDHGTGHGVGSFLNVHEGPQRISKMASKVALQAGMVVSNEPGYYKTGAYGIRLENLIYVRKADIAGSERNMLEFDSLTLCPFDQKGIDASLLDDQEIDWLNAYQARVRDELTPLLDREDADWLAEVTQPFAKSQN